jgi:hypothetical protein
MTLDIRTFGDALIRTRDLDPLYVGLVGAALPRDQLARYLLAYACFYHCGSAAWLSQCEGDHYWRVMRTAAVNEISPREVGGLTAERWSRAAERRHFRGEKCVRAVEWLRNEYERPENPITSLLNAPMGALIGQFAGTLTEKVVMGRVQEWPLFGPWIAFKCADMLERVWGAPIAFDRNLGLMYEEPRAALQMLIDDPADPERYNTRADAYNDLLDTFSRRPAPPAGDRMCGPQEVETVLCKWKSHVGGHYWVGKDIHEQRAALVGWGDTAARILRAYPEEVER